MKKMENCSFQRLETELIREYPPLPIQGPSAHPSRSWQFYRTAENLPNAFSLIVRFYQLSYPYLP